MPRDREGWKKLIDELSTLMDEASPNLRHSTEDLHHRRAQEPYPSVARGVSYGGGQTEPGCLLNNAANTKVTDRFLRDIRFQRLVKWANLLFFLFAPLLAAFYQSQMDELAGWKPSLVWNFAGSVFAACTFNFGPQVITVPHLDFGNLSWGWCAITALGWFDPDLGGHLILWDLKLVIRFPPGATILIPSAIVRHSNVPIRAHEKRFSFVQYTAGGLFQWIRNGFKTDEAFENTGTREERMERTKEAKTRWGKGVAMYSTSPSTEIHQKYGFKAYWDHYKPLLNEFNHYCLPGVRVEVPKEEQKPTAEGENVGEKFINLIFGLDEDYCTKA
ncbi:hypothetical protein C8F04DRAFT_1406340 [Mycena alexandri]|uniref:Uncharacterized protein n=1 Tax=Mycena alexandri TaxID=1745969 RepID=A0AAD6WKH0_9AGAR|nr:hypothetical protein C8F04DRAFT_1406340 [Mycena alexandri]